MADPAWAIADADAVWTSALVGNGDIPTIRVWHRHDPHTREMWLKDTMTGYYDNRLVNANTYTYEVPSQTSPTRDFDAVETLRTEARRTRKTLRVCLVAAGNAFTHDMGQWLVAAFEDDPAVLRRPNAWRVTLKRLKRQRAPPGAAHPERKRFRSGSEARHLECIVGAFPSDWRVRHEPESINVPHMPLVVDGERVPWVGDGITMDYVAVGPGPLPRRVCIESKCCAEDAWNDVALQKCRVLRDRCLVHVLLIFGHGGDLRWLDFGTDAAPHDPPILSERADYPQTLL